MVEEIHGKVERCLHKHNNCYKKDEHDRIPETVIGPYNKNWREGSKVKGKFQTLCYVHAGIM
jgi:hypothetical protein